MINLSDYKNIVIQFSGGKDSLACLEYCKDYKDKVTVVWCDTGDTFNHVRHFVAHICNHYGYKLKVARPETSVLEWTDRVGYPSPIVPIWSSKALGYLQDIKSKPTCLVQSTADCCNRNLWLPLHEKILELGPDLLVRGSKVTDSMVSVGPLVDAGNFKVWCPFWDYTDEEVLDYLKAHSVELPHQYTVGCVNSLDCTQCTGWITSEGERQRIAYTKEYYPLEFKALSNKFKKVQTEIIRRMEELQPCIEELNNV